jgi:hypothetical protein
MWVFLYFGRHSHMISQFTITLPSTLILRSPYSHTTLTLLSTLTLFLPSLLYTILFPSISSHFFSPISSSQSHVIACTNQRQTCDSISDGSRERRYVEKVCRLPLYPLADSQHRCDCQEGSLKWYQTSEQLHKFSVHTRSPWKLR